MSVGIVVPCYNEENNISRVIQTLPSCIDHIIVIDDASFDSTKEVVKKLMKKDNRIKYYKLNYNYSYHNPYHLISNVIWMQYNYETH